MEDTTERSRLSRLLGSITFQFILFVGLVVVYNRIVFTLHTPSSEGGFSDWAAPLYAFSQPIPTVSLVLLSRWIAPIVIAIAWIVLAMKWIGRPEKSSHDTNARGSATTPNAAPARGSLTFIALGVVLALNLTTAMMDDGVRSIGWPFSRTGEEYFGDALHTRDAMTLLREYPTMHLSRHARTHPPGGVLLLWVVRKIAGGRLLAGSLAAAVLTALALLPAAAIARSMLGDRGGLVFTALYALTPNLVLFGATSMDGVFACVLLAGAWVFFSGPRDPTFTEGNFLHGVHLGVWLALGTFFTFASFAMIVLFIVYWLVQCVLDRGNARMTLITLLIAAVTMVACFAALYATTGCSIIACVRASVAFDAQQMRPVRAAYLDASITNLLGFLVGSGFIATTLWMRSVPEACPTQRVPRQAGQLRAGMLAIAMAITLTGLSFSTLFTRELERVWMFLTPLLLIGAAGALDRIISPAHRRGWIAATMILLFAQTWLTQLLLNTVW